MESNLSEKQLVNKLIENKANYYQLAARPFTIQRFEIIGYFSRKFLNSSMLALPLASGADSCWLDSTAAKRAFRQQSAAMLKPGVWEKQKNHYILSCEKLKLVSSAVLDCKPNKQSLSNFFERWQETLDDFSYYFIAPFWVEEYLFPQLEKLIKDEKDLEIICSPGRVFFYQQFQKDLLLMGNKLDYNYLKTKYAALTEYSLKEKLLDKKEINRRWQEIKEQKLADNILKTEQRARINQRSFLSLYKNLPPDSAILADIIHEYVSIRTERIEFYQQALVRIRHFYKLLAKLMARSYPGFNYLDAVSLTNSEIRSFLNNKSNISISDIRARAQRHFALFYNEGRENSRFIYNSKLINKLSEYFLSVTSVKDGIIKGVVVSSGIVSGRVRIIYRPDQFNTFKTGEILVSNYTSPAFMPLIKKAAAIITDEGGITSHAAIVSRELGVPCVTGLKTATSVLHDGDLVEVDANKGMVTILKQ